MKTNALFCLALSLCLALCIALIPQDATAGLWDKLKKDMKEAGQEAGIIDKPAKKKNPDPL